MPAKTKNAPAKKRSIPLPGSVNGWLCRDQVCAALGGCSTRYLDKLIAAGKFPRGDKNLGRNPRWTVKLINEWCEVNTAKLEES